jgi:predicted ATPase
VLGPLLLTVGDVAVDVPGPKRRALLALLTMAEGRAVPIDDLLAALWPGDLPDSALGTLQSHVSRLRRHLGPAAARLERVSGAYRLRLNGPGSGSDLARARSLLAAAGAADPAEARTLLGEARALWRGPPLAEFTDVAPLSASAVTFAELQRAIDGALAEAALAAGGLGEAVELATALVGAEPLSEPPALVLMRALAASGRAADALRAGHEHRRRLAEESGLDPSPALAELEREIAGGSVAGVRPVPRSTTVLRGRDSELAALHRLLERDRLLTVLGPGGVGKTRLAVELATRSDHVTALLLAPVVDAEAIPHALAEALDLHVVQGDVLAACAALLASGPQLLLVDNCEHLLPAARAVITALLDACPDLTVLATSREPLGLAGERHLRIAPLPLSPVHNLADLDRSPAAALFVDRVRRVRPEFAPGGDDLGRIDDIVRRLDGLPLAIELAAARLSSLDLEELHARLDRSLDLLGDSRSTLRNTLEWSYDLLPEPEQRLFRHAGVFPDGFDLEAAEAVGGKLGLEVDPVAALAHLVDASMVEATLGSPTRYRMLDTMRSFARDRLEALDEGQGATDLFLRWALDLVAWIDRTIATEVEPDADRRLRRELANLRAAWGLCRERGRIDEAVQLVVGLADAAGWRDLTEVWAWEVELADDPALAGHPAAGTVLGLAAGGAWARGELARADGLVRAGFDLGGENQACLASAGMIALSRGDLPEAVQRSTRAADLAVRADQSLGIAALGTAYHGDLEEASAHAERLAAIATSPTVLGFAHYVTAEIASLAADTDAAMAHYERAIALARESGATFVDGIASVGLVSVRASSGRTADALEGYRDLVDYWERTGGWVQQWTTLRNLAGLLRDLDDADTALYLEAAALAAADAPAIGVSERADPAALAHPAATASRAQVLEVAREAIDRHHTALASRS